MNIQKRRTIVIPILQGLVWAASILISIFLNFDDIESETHTTRSLLIFAYIILIFELGFILVDISLALNGYYIDRNLKFHIQCRNIPFAIFAIPLCVYDYISVHWICIFFSIIALAGLKSGMLQTVVEIDDKKKSTFDLEV